MIKQTRSAILLSIAVLFCSSVASAQTHQHGSMPAEDGSFNPYVVADRRGGFFVAYIERSNGQCDVMLKYSADGFHFTDAVRVNDRRGDAAVRNENPPKVAVASTGEVYVCWSNEREKWKGDIRFARSTDGGKTFSPAVTVNSDAGGPPTGHAFQSVAVDEQGRVYVDWIDERNKKPSDRGAEIWMAVSDNRGKDFSRDHKILSDVCECCRTSVQIGAAGTLLLSYRSVPRTGPMQRDVFLARSADRGVSFSTSPVSLDRWEVDVCPVAGPAMCADTAGNITVVWFTGGGERPGLYVAKSADGGRSFSPRRPLDDAQRMSKRAQMVASPQLGVVVAWEDQGRSPSTLVGVLEPGVGFRQRGSAFPYLSFPTLAVNDRVVVVAGMKFGREVSIISLPLQD